MRPLLDREIISQVIAEIPRSTRNTEEWQIGANQSGKYAAIPTPCMESEYRATLNDLPTFVLLARNSLLDRRENFGRMENGLVLTRKIIGKEDLGNPTEKLGEPSKKEER